MQLKQTILAVSTGLALASLSMGSLACTTLIVGKNVSETGRVMVGHTEDAGGLKRLPPIGPTCST
mgnify:CR=1 FL=1